jgi:hypothetical protein
MSILLITTFTLLCVTPSFASEYELLKLQHDHSTCQDLHTLVEFRRTYNISHALQHASEFFQVREVLSNQENRYHVSYSCEKIFIGKEEKEAVWPPPTLEYLRNNNKAYLDDLCLNDPAIYISNLYFQEKQNGGTGYVWTESQINDIASQARGCGTYDSIHCDGVVRKYKSFIEGRVGMVVGSQSPWAEALGLRHGAARMITYEYMKITNSHPRLTTYTPAEAAALYLSGKWEPVDFIFTYSSLEHDGLGRYGDPLNAFGDLESIAKMHCMLKPNGLLFFGVPFGFDEIQFNAHRIYGYRRLSVVFSLGFRLVDIVNEKPFLINKYNSWEVQPLMVMQKHELHHGPGL